MRQNNHVVEVQKTDKIDIDKDVHELPPGNGIMAEYRVADWFCPDEWSKDGVFIPVKEGQPLWFDLRGNGECACLPAVQRANPVIGKPADLEAGLSKDPEQNYLTLPEQRWLDGYVNDGKVYQFIITKAGEGLAVNEFILPKHMQDSHAVGFAFFEPKNPKPVPPPPHRYRTGGLNAGVIKGLGPVTYSEHSISTSGSFGSLARGVDVSCDAGASASCDDLFEASLDAFADDGREIFLCADGGSGIEETGVPVLVAADVDAAVIEDPEVVDILEQKEEQDLAKASMGQGGRIDQLIVTDENTTDYYHDKPSAVLTIYFALPGVFESIMKKGKRQDKTRPDKYKMSGKVGGVQVPLI